jgi:hypothetical protein
LPDSDWVTSSARKKPTTIPSAAPINDVTTLSWRIILRV